MNLYQERLQLLTEIEIQGRDILNELERGTDFDSFLRKISGYSQVISELQTIVPQEIYGEYWEFFDAFCEFCGQCGDPDFMRKNVENMVSSLSLSVECIEDIKMKCLKKIKRCICCEKRVAYLPLPDYYRQMEEKYHVPQNTKSETLNLNEYSCPECGASDRDRMIISFLKKARLRDAAEGAKVLQIAPAASIGQWIIRHCPQTVYETTDLFMSNVTFRSDLQDMNMVADEAYDVIICSHVLEHVRDDRKALGELKRILKPDGKIIFLVPVDLNRKETDEEWGLSEAENWRRFGQGDHCRVYSKEDLTDRLQEQFYVHSLGKDYFGEDVFEQCGLIDTSTLYVLTKQEEVPLDMAEQIRVDEILCKEGPLVSVIMSCYNHESFVAEAIESVINQSYKNIEFIVADDASSDHTAEIMKRYSAHYAKEMYFEENIGGRSEFLQQYATGKYIALMHSDDVWERDKLALQVAYMEEHEDCGACLTWCVYTDENLRETHDWYFFQKNKSSSEWMHYFWKYGNALCNPSSLTRRELCMNIKKTPCTQLPDFFKWIYVIQHTSIYIVPKALVKMRRYQGSHSENTSVASENNIMRHMAEAGCNWLWVIRDMEKDFFKQAFGELMIHPDADTEEEIKCEKYFLMLNHINQFVQYSAMCYLCEIFDSVKECMENKYHYSYKEFREDIIKKGITPSLKEKG